MAKKFDTNPLDPEFPKKVAESQTAPQTGQQAEQQTVALPNTGASTQQFPQGVTATGTEDQTKAFNNADYMGYQPIYQQPQYQTLQLQPAEVIEKPTSRKVAGIGLPENVLMVLPYVPWGFGLVAGLVELLLVPRSETKVRFHAAQGLALHLAVLVVSAILGIVGAVSDWADFGQGLFHLVVLIMFIVSMVKVWQGKPVHYESLDEAADWLNEKVIYNKS
jgi:uncharacterized membrane protein